MDLDDEELKATRRMNGSDKNVACMEEDIKILENLLEEGFEAMCYLEAQAIEHLIKAYKELKRENRKLSKANETYIKSIQNITPVLMNDYIEKSLVEEKIKEINNEDENLMYKHNIIRVLQELLEGK